jgi:hypothetical protein
VARKHYLQVREEDFIRAAQNPAHTAQKEAQQAHADGRIEAHKDRTEGPENAEMLVSVGATGLSEDGGMGVEGFEPSTG